ncbi:MAG TPA: FkbM family methyltransferase [Caulobacteraceae bacterium]
MRRLVTLLHDALRAAPDFRGRKRALKVLLRFMDEATSFFGPKLTVRARDHTFIASYFARYGSELTDLIDDMPPDGVFLEFGANTGVYSLVAARHLSQGRCVAVEPNPFVFQDLLNNIRINDARNVLALNFSIAEASGLAPFEYSPDHTGKGHLGDADASARRSQIVLIRHDEFARLLPGLEDRFCLCKIDTEGAELSILKAMEAAGLIGGIDVFYIEIDQRYLARQGGSGDEIYEILARHGLSPTTDRRGRQHYDEIFRRT